MADNSRRRNTFIALAIIVIVILLLLTRCWPKKAANTPQQPPPVPAGAADTNTPAPTQSATPEPAEVLTAATLALPEQVAAGAAFAVAWTGPDNRGDFVTIVRPDAAGNVYANYRDTKEGPTLELTASIDPGKYEVRYVTGRSKTILARVPIEVVAALAALDAAAEVTLGATFTVAWTGPNNDGDYVTITTKDAADDKYLSYANTSAGSPLTLTAPADIGDAELRYVTGQGRKVLARRPIKVITASVTLAAPAEAIAGTTIEVAWTGPNNAGDYITLVPIETPDGKYLNYTNTTAGSPLKLLAPIMDGRAEIRYMTGQGHRVISRRAITINAAVITLAAPSECAAGAAVSITWTGPNNPGDYITIVPKSLPDGQFRDYKNTTSGSPLSVKAPKETGDAEVRYMTGQGSKVLARFPVSIIP